MFFYNVVTRIYFSLIRIASPFSTKAKLWTKGRKNWKSTLKTWTFDHQPIWVHVSSLGEFEQARHFIETVKSQYPRIPLVLTFFSPSGYEIRKDYPLADYILYLPTDTQGNARIFLETINPVCALFVKYDLWFNYIDQCQNKGIPLFLISAIFSSDQYFFKPWGRTYKKYIQNFEKIFVQDKASQDCLIAHGFTNSLVAGDTRVDRACEIMKSAQPHPTLSSFADGKNIFIAGSNWPEDDEVLIPLLNKMDHSWKVILAPHDISESSINRLSSKLKGSSYCRFTSFDKMTNDCRILILDTIGHLSSAYKIGHVAYIGGGFKKGIHNTLEPAAAGLPIIFGPNFASFKEAVTFVDRQLAFTIGGANELINIFEEIKDRAIDKEFVEIAEAYLNEESGATELVINEMVQRKILK